MQWSIASSGVLPGTVGVSQEAKEFSQVGQGVDTCLLSNLVKESVDTADNDQVYIWVHFQHSMQSSNRKLKYALLDYINFLQKKIKSKVSMIIIDFKLRWIKTTIDLSKSFKSDACS